MEPTACVFPASDPTCGTRFRVGAFALAHARAPTDDDANEFGFAPGVALGLGWRVATWELGVEARGAYRGTMDRGTRFGSVGGRARWFTAPRSDISPYLSLGLDLIGLRADSLYGVGPSLHAALGLEVWHDGGHHRLSIEVGADIPAFLISEPQETEAAGEGGASYFDHTVHDVYAVPATIATNWTF
jgi:hypothetical protein